MGNDDDELCQPCDINLIKIFIDFFFLCQPCDINLIKYIVVFFFFANPVTTAVATTAVATTAVATIAATDLEAPGFDHLAARGGGHFQAPGEQQFASRCNNF